MRLPKKTTASQPCLVHHPKTGLPWQVRSPTCTAKSGSHHRKPAVENEPTNRTFLGKSRNIGTANGKSWPRKSDVPGGTRLFLVGPLLQSLKGSLTQVSETLPIGRKACTQTTLTPGVFWTLNTWKTLPSSYSKLFQHVSTSSHIIIIIIINFSLSLSLHHHLGKWMVIALGVTQWHPSRPAKSACCTEHAAVGCRKMLSKKHAMAMSCWGEGLILTRERVHLRCSAPLNYRSLPGDSCSLTSASISSQSLEYRLIDDAASG